MRAAWDWFAGLLPERMLRTFDLVPFVVETRRSRWQSEKNAFDLGRDYGRTETGRSRRAARPAPTAPQGRLTTHRTNTLRRQDAEGVRFGRLKFSIPVELSPVAARAGSPHKHRRLHQT